MTKPERQLKDSVTREELYQMIWEEPVTKIAKAYGISNNAIRKKCKKMNVPLPPLGYWSKVQHGYKPKIIKLPKDKKCPQTTSLKVEEYTNARISNTITTKNKRKKEIIAEIKTPLKVPVKIKCLDPLISSAKKSLSSKNQSSYLHIDFVATNNGELSIHVGKDNVNRALRIMQTLINLLRARGHDLIVDRYTYAVIKGEKLPIRLRERMRTEDVLAEGRLYSTRYYHPSGVLVFVAEMSGYNRKEWYDRASKKIEEQMLDILAFLELKAEEEIQYKIDSERRQKLREEQQKIEAEIRKRKEEKLDQFRQLIDHANYWRQSQVIREYLEVFESKENLSETETLWLQQVNQLINWFDPMTTETDELLTCSDRTRLIEELKSGKVL